MDCGSFGNIKRSGPTVCRNKESSTKLRCPNALMMNKRQSQFMSRHKKKRLLNFCDHFTQFLHTQHTEKCFRKRKTKGQVTQLAVFKTIIFVHFDKSISK